MLLKKEKEALGYFSDHEVELCSRPFLEPARNLNMTESQLVGLLKRLQKRGIIKYLRGLINHVKAGYRQNALIAWRSNSRGIKSQEKLLRDVFLADSRISHCYKRKPHKAFNYNLYTMMHAKTRKEIVAFAKKSAQRFKLSHEILFTEKELKKEKLNLKTILQMSVIARRAKR